MVYLQAYRRLKLAYQLLTTAWLLYFTLFSVKRLKKIILHRGVNINILVTLIDLKVLFPSPFLPLWLLSLPNMVVTLNNLHEKLWTHLQSFPFLRGRIDHGILHKYLTKNCLKNCEDQSFPSKFNAVISLEAIVKVMMQLHSNLR